MAKIMAAKIQGMARVDFRAVRPNFRLFDLTRSSDKIVGLKENRLRMRWFRQHIRYGSWFALVALAINLTLAFGHIHGFGGKAPEEPGALVAALAAADGGQGQHQPSDDHPDYLCPICMAATAIGNALASTPPALQVEFTTSRIDQPIDHFRYLPQTPRAAFQSRGPPLT